MFSPAIATAYSIGMISMAGGNIRWYNGKNTWLFRQNDVVLTLLLRRVPAGMDSHNLDNVVNTLIGR